MAHVLGAQLGDCPGVTGSYGTDVTLIAQIWCGCSGGRPIVPTGEPTDLPRVVGACYAAASNISLSGCPLGLPGNVCGAPRVSGGGALTMGQRRGVLSLRRPALCGRSGSTRRSGVGNLA